MSTTIGLDKLYVHPLTEDTESKLTYGTPQRIFGVREITISPSTNTSTLAGDNAPMYTISNISEITIDIESCDLTAEEKALLLGATYDTATGEVITKNGQVGSYVGLSFEAKKANGSVRYCKVCKVRFAENDETYTTLEDSVTWNTPKLSGAAVARQHDGQIKRTLDADDSKYQASQGTAWHTSFEATA